MTAAVTFVEAAQGHFQQGEFARCEQVARQGLSLHPDTGRLWELVGLSCWLRNRLDDALTALESASLFVPLAPLAQLALASAYAWADKRDLARSVYRHLCELPSFPIPLMPQLAAGLGRIGENEAALLVCENLVELRPTFHPGWFGVAHYRRRLGWPLDLVLEALQTAHDLAPTELPYRLNLAACLAQVGQSEAAYRLACDVPLEEVTCPHWLEVMLPVFVAIGDRERETTCRRTLESLDDEGCSGCGE